MRKGLLIPCNGMLQEFEKLCQSTISLITQRGRKGRREEKSSERVWEKEQQTFACICCRYPLLSVIATDRIHTLSTLELVAGNTLEARSVFGLVDCFDSFG